MGTSRSPEEFVGKLVKFGHAIEFQSERAAKAGAEATRAIFVNTAAMSPGSALPRHSGARWGARYNIRGKKRPTALVSYVGPVHLVHNPTKPHWILSKKAGGTAATRGMGVDFNEGRQAIRTPRGLRYYVAKHPGTRGKPWFARTKDTVQSIVPRIIAKHQVLDPMRSIFR